MPKESSAAAGYLHFEARNERSLKRLENREGWGALSVKNLFAAIEARRDIAMHRFIYALGIPHVGDTSAKLLARHFGTFETLREAARARRGLRNRKLTRS